MSPESETAPLAKLSPIAKKFIRDWGELGERWGLERSAAEAHALLFLSGRALTPGRIAEALSLDEDEARKAVNDLVTWKVVRAAAEPGSDGEDRFECLPDVVEMFRAILEEKRRREIDPAVAVLRDCLLRAESDAGMPADVVRRLESMQDLFRLSQGFYKHVGTMSSEPTLRLLKLGQKIRQSLGG